MKGFKITSLSEIGRCAIQGLVDSDNIIKKGIIPNMISSDPYVVFFELHDRKLKKFIKPKDINLFIPMLMRHFGATLGFDYILEVEE